MLHELLLALDGCPGSIFSLRHDKIALDGSLPFFNPSERHLLDDLCQLGSWYRCVRVFVDRHCTADDGKYVRALCAALGPATAPYQALLKRLECELLDDPGLGVAYVFQAVQPQAALLGALAALLDDVERLGAAGCRLLDVLHRHVAASSGGPRRQLQLLLQRCHRQLLAQLATWLLYGLLADSAGEFFLRERTAPDAPDGAVFAKVAAAERELPPPPIEYELRSEMLPSYLPLRLCQSVLFVGNSIQMCRQFVEGGVEPLCDIMAGHERQFAVEFEALAAQPTLSPFRLEQLVNRIKALVTRHLWQVIVVDVGLVEHLTVMKAFFLMGRGSLFQELFTESDHMLRGPIKAADAERDMSWNNLNEAFAVACGRVGLEEEAVLDSMCLSLAPEPVGQRLSGWDRLRLNCRVRWPLHLLYTPSVMASYNDIFNFLLQVKRTQIMLERLWASQMTEKRQPHSAPRTAAHQLRAHMAFLVNNLQYYLHVDVLESEHSRLLAAVAATDDYEQLRHAHDCFLSDVLSQCFLQSPPVLECLRDLLSACRDFCVAGQQQQDLQQLQLQLQRKSQLLFRIMSSLKDQRASSHLSRLLLRIDFNRFMSRGL